MGSDILWGFQLKIGVCTHLLTIEDGADIGRAVILDTVQYVEESYYTPGIHPLYTLYTPFIAVYAPKYTAIHFMAVYAPIYTYKHHIYTIYIPYIYHIYTIYTP